MLLPGTASSRLRALSKLGDTYCRSNVVSCGNCFSTFLNTWGEEFISEPSDNLERPCLLHSRCPKLYPIHLRHYTCAIDGMLHELRGALDRRLEQRMSHEQW